MAQPAPASLRVLLVERDSAFASFVERALTAPPPDQVTVTLVDRLSAAISALSEGPPDVILVDLDLPDSGGVATLDRLSAHARAIPLVIFMEMDREDLLLACIERGADDFIAKGNASETALRRIVRIAIERGRNRDARQRDEHMRMILSRLPIVIWSTDTNLRITSSEGFGLRGAGVAPHELVGRPLADVGGGPEGIAVSSCRDALSGEWVRYENEWHGCMFETYQGPLQGPTGDVIGTAALSIDVTARRVDDAHLRETIERLRALRTRVDTIREEEGSRIARDIHDHIGQTLTAVKMDVAHVRRQIAGVFPPLPEADERLGSMADLLELAVQDLRRVATELRPHILDDVGVLAAIEWQVRDFEHRTGVTCAFASDVAAIDMPSSHATAVYRIVQEALTNIMRHAAATHVDVRAWTKGADAYIRVRDNGRGLDSATTAPFTSLGLLGMSERAKMFSGTVAITSDGPGQGTTVLVCFPMS